MMRRILAGVALGLGGLVAASGAEAAGAKPAERFAFVAFGCMPYGPENFPAYERLLTEISRHHPAFTVHCGDTKGGGEPPFLAGPLIVPENALPVLPRAKKEAAKK